MGEEILTIYDEQMNPTGEMPRSSAHASGHWHRVVHVWLYGIFRGEICLFLQKRSAQKSTYPGYYDAGATGHMAAGEENDLAAIREVKEEMGILLLKEDLNLLGECREDSPQDREIASVYLAFARSDDLMPGEEVESVAAIPLSRFESLVRREKDGAAARTLSGERLFITRDKLCPHTESAMMAIRALQAIR